MALYRGGSEPSAIYRGTVPVQKVMRGTVEVWSAVVPSIYPVSGTWSGMPGFTPKVMASHTIVEAGTFTVTHNATSGSAAPNIRYPGGETSGTTGNATWTGTLSVGDLLEFVAWSFGSTTCEWTVTKH